MIGITMKRKLIFVVVFVLLLGAILGGMKLLSGRAPKQGILKVQSTSAASVFLDNKHIGRTPLEEKIDAGEYAIRLVPESTVQSLATWQSSIKVAPGLLTFVNGSMAESEFTTAAETLWLEKITSKDAEISVTTNPDGASVSLDGSVKGVTPLSIPGVPAGDHTLTVASAGFVSRSLKIKTTGGFKVVTTVKLALSGEAAVQPTEATASPTPTGADKGSAKTTPTPKPTKAASSSDPAKPFVTIKDTPTGFLRVRMEPSTSASEAGRVNPEEKYHVEEEKSGWYQILYNGKDEGWISGQYAEKTE
ncbi:MAG: hypothetical protein UY10_C0012G0001 [Microgenomates group bacterium GW2011_GWA2_47_8]|nr:MAG: hypothetical protein UY10_C0012G0001 [Microgenomates group bacterium GW2011_GWA2_47_8]